MTLSCTEKGFAGVYWHTIFSVVYAFTVGEKCLVYYGAWGLLSLDKVLLSWVILSYTWLEQVQVRLRWVDRSPQKITFKKLQTYNAKTANLKNSIAKQKYFL